MKKFIKVIDFCLPAVIYIACSLIAFLFWNLFEFAAAPIISTSVILCVIGSLLAGFLSKGKTGKKGMFLTIAIIVAACILWIVVYNNDGSFKEYAAYIATAFSSYLFNIQTCLPISAPQFTLYIGYALSIIVPIALILLGRFLRIKIFKHKA